MKRTPILTVLAIAMMFFVSCKGKSGFLIPKDAGFVVEINSKSLSEKLPWKEISSTDWFNKAMSQQKDSFVKKIMQDPKESGIDISSSLYIFRKNDGRNGYMAFEGSLTDKAAFEALNKKITEEKNPDAKVESDGDLNYMMIDNGSVVTWNDKNFVYLTGSPSKSSYSYGETPAVGFDTLRKIASDLFSMEEKNSLNSDDRFTSLMKEEGDIHFWMNSQYMYEDEMIGPMTMAKPLFEGNVATGTLNFENGKIVMSGKQYYGKELTEVLEKHNFGNASKDMVNRIPSQNVALAMVANYPPEVIRDVLKVSRLDGMVNSFLGNMNITLDDVIKSIKGEMVISVSDFKMKEQQVVKPAFYQEDPSGMPGMPDMNILIAGSINDRASFDKVANVISTQFQGKPLPIPVNYKVENGWFAVSNSSQQVDQFLSGNGNQQAFADKISGHPYGMYIDIQKILSVMNSPSGQNMFGGMIMDASMKMWQDVVITAGEFKNGYMVSEMEINLVDKETNSLKQLYQYLGQIGNAFNNLDNRFGNPDSIPMPSDTLMSY